MKILCVCNRGNVRSSCMAQQLRYRGHDSLSIGTYSEQFSDDLFKMMCNWAELIFDFSDTDTDRLEPYKSKVRRFDIGKDVWKNPFHPELKKLMRNIIKSSKEDLKKEVKK